MNEFELMLKCNPSQKKKESSSKFSENFYVIQFEDGIALVPNNWLQISDDQKQQVCFYPRYNTTKRLFKAVETKEKPDLKNVKAGWSMYDVLRIFASADTFERGKEKFKMAESMSDVNTEDEENIKQTRYKRAKKITSDDEYSETEIDSDLLPPLPDPMEFSKSQQTLNSEKSLRILATSENPIISFDTIEKVQAEQVTTRKKNEDKHQQVFINDSDCFIDENVECTPHSNDDQSTKVLKDILKKVNRILIELTYLDRRLHTLENKVDNFANKEINIKVDENNFAFDAISSVDELQVFEDNLKNEEFFMKMRNFLKLKGGTNLQDIVKTIFKTLLKDEILMLYSWKGARGKNVFRSFKIVKLIIAVVRLHESNSIEENIVKHMKNWIIQAPARVRRIINKQQTMASEQENLM